MSKAIFGVGVFGELVYRRLLRLNERVHYFVLDKPQETHHLGVRILTTEEYLSLPMLGEIPIFVAVGPSRMNTNRSKVFQRLKQGGAQFYNLAPEGLLVRKGTESTFIGNFVSLDESVNLGNCVVLWDGSVISHDVTIEDYVYISPQVGIGAYCRIGKNSFLGMGCMIKPKVELEAGTLVGAGAYISENTIVNGVYVSPKPEFLGAVSMRVDLSR